MKYILFILIPIFTFSQVKLPNVPQPTQFQQYGNQNFGVPTNMQPPNPLATFYGTDEQSRIQKQNQQIILETQQREIETQKAKQEIYKDIATNKPSINYSLPSFSSNLETQYYYDVFDKIIQLDTANYSVKDITFLIENAHFNNAKSKDEFDNHIKQTKDFLIAKMKELNYDLSSNSAKNFILFQFFSETLQLKNNNDLKHLPFKYDFEDFMGIKDHSKMFVTKLMETGSGQCHSMPLLYLILAEQIQAEAYLALSPNHSYIRFPDDNGKWHNVELTNGMFSTTSSILNSGYIKSEALQNKIYMQNLSKKELLSQFYVDLASGYIHKFGNDEFASNVINRALELNPNNVNANMVKANIDVARFEYVMYNLKIDPRDNNQLQQIKYYPQAVQLLNQVNSQFNKVDNLGYEQMSAQAYQDWLQAMRNERNKEYEKEIAKNLKVTFKKQIKN
jgi:hypothetical protein